MRPNTECRKFRIRRVRNCMVFPTTSRHRKNSPPNFPMTYNGIPAIARSCGTQYNIRHQPAAGTLYRYSGVAEAYSWSISTMIFRYSNQQPKWITVNNSKKLQGFHNNPVSM